MDKKYFSPLELIEIATRHVYCAEHLFQDNAEISVNGGDLYDTLAPFISLMYIAFELTLKAYLAHDFKINNQHKNLAELLELSSVLGLTNQDIQMLKKLSRQYSFRKGINYGLWDDRQQLQIFCAELIVLYERLQQLMPLELHKEYS